MGLATVALTATTNSKENKNEIAKNKMTALLNQSSKFTLAEPKPGMGYFITHNLGIDVLNGNPEGITSRTVARGVSIFNVELLPANDGYSFTLEGSDIRYQTPSIWVLAEDTLPNRSLCESFWKIRQLSYDLMEEANTINRSITSLGDQRVAK